MTAQDRWELENEYFSRDHITELYSALDPAYEAACDEAAMAEFHGPFLPEVEEPVRTPSDDLPF